MKNIVYFDLETRRSAAQVGGWHEASKMGMSVGVTYSTKDNAYHIYTEDQVMQLIEELQNADMVVGYNHVGFDYQVLQAFAFWTIADNTRNLDICSYLSSKLGHRLKLDSVASVTLGHSKTAEGTDALKWWAEYEQTGDPQK
ncbi:MAG: ribonuclease H-like domain-containing protein, partial [Akkermansia sp.]|nr:ribonuclease H-like domain-containing protein [Akkermansia sp.]